MASRLAIRRLAMRASPIMRESGVNSGASHVLNAEGRQEARSTLQKGAKKDPELYVCHFYPYPLSLRFYRLCSF